MEKTELMIEYEIKIDSVVNWEANPIGYAKYLESELIKERAKPTITYQAVETFQEIIRNQCDEITALKEKAEAYDRIMSGGKKTLKEFANLLGRVVVVNSMGDIQSFAGEPKIDLHYGFWYLDEDDEDYEGFEYFIPPDLIDFSGNWRDSLTLPDGWETKGENK